MSDGEVEPRASVVDPSKKKKKRPSKKEKKTYEKVGASETKVQTP